MAKNTFPLILLKTDYHLEVFRDHLLILNEGINR